MKISNIFKKKNSFPGEEGEDGIGKKALDNNSGLSYFYYSYDGTIGGNNYHYRIENKDGEYTFEYEAMDHDDYGKMTAAVDSSVIDKLNDLYLKCRVAEWDGYSKYNSMICDGDGFSLSLKFNDKKHMSASGSNAYPERYRQFYDGMNEILSPFRDKLLYEARQNKIKQGLIGNLTLLIVLFKQRGSSGRDEYKFILSNDTNSSNYQVTIKSYSGKFFSAGEYNKYQSVPSDLIPMKEIQALIEKYDLIKWYDHHGVSDDKDNSEWYQIQFCYDSGDRLNSSGTEHLKNYNEFRAEFLQLMAKTAKNIQ